MPLVKLINTVFRGYAGETIRAFGHDFIIQPDGTAVCNMHKDFLPTETKAGRVEVIDPAYLETAAEKVEEKLFKVFDEDPQTYFGSGSITALKEKIRKLKADEIRQFAEKFIGVTFPATMGKDALIFKVCEKIEELNQPKEG